MHTGTRVPNQPHVQMQTVQVEVIDRWQTEHAHFWRVVEDPNGVCILDELELSERRVHVGLFGMATARRCE